MKKISVKSIALPSTLVTVALSVILVACDSGQAAPVCGAGFSYLDAVATGTPATRTDQYCLYRLDTPAAAQAFVCGGAVPNRFQVTGNNREIVCVSHPVDQASVCRVVRGHCVSADAAADQ